MVIVILLPISHQELQQPSVLPLDVLKHLLSNSAACSNGDMKNSHGTPVGKLKNQEEEVRKGQIVTVTHPPLRTCILYTFLRWQRSRIQTMTHKLSVYRVLCCLFF